MIKIVLKNSSALAQKIQELADENKVEGLSRFFKTGSGQYGEGDKFLGITMPKIRQLVKDSAELKDKALEELLTSSYHEIRMLGALFMLRRYQEAKGEKSKTFALNYYLAHYSALNNWDLVDLTVSKIWGDYLISRPQKRAKLYSWARSKNMWQRRMSIVATASLIKANDLVDTLNLSKILLSDEEDLIHKAVGWMLRELGKKDRSLLLEFINENISKMPRTTLRYSIEHFPEPERKKILQIKC